LQIRSDKADGPLFGGIKIPEGRDWNTIESQLLEFLPGIHNLVVVLKDKNTA